MKYFTIKELTKSITATKKGINNTPNKSQEQCLTTLVEKVLDPLREALGMSIIVNSGFRCPALNKLVGGAATSQHTKGQAVDIQTVGDKWNYKLFTLAKTMDYDQLIFEHGTDSCPDWVHISYVSKERNRHEILRATKKNGKTIYTKIK